MAAIRDRLGAVPVFADAAPATLAALANITEEHSVNFGSVLVAQGQPHEATYVIIDGAVSVVIDNHAYPSVGAGGIIGELALFVGCDSAPATITTIAHTTLLAIHHAAFRQVLGEHPDLWQSVAIEFAGRLHALDTEHTQWASNQGAQL